MKSPLLTFLFILIYQSNFAQGLKTETTNRSIIQDYDEFVFVGNIIADNTLKMKTLITTNNTANISTVLVKSLKREEDDNLYHEITKLHNTHAIFYSFQAGSHGGTDPESNQLSFITGYRFNKKWAAGLGIGYHYNSDREFNSFLAAYSLPIFAYGRFYPLETKVRPFIAGNIGWGFAIQRNDDLNHNGGFYFQPELGVNYVTKKKLGFILSIGQQLHNIRGEILDFDAFGNIILSKYKLWLNRTILKIGLEWR